MNLQISRTVTLLRLLPLPLLAAIVAAACSSADGGSKSGAGAPGSGGTTGVNPTCPGGICISTPTCPGGICVPETGADCEGEKQIIIAGVPRLGPLTGLPSRFERAEPVSEECAETISWVPPEQTPVTPEVPPPAQETFECPAGMTRVHVRDIWSSLASPTLNKLTERPAAVYLEDSSMLFSAGTKFVARQESAGCDWYSTCIPPELTAFGLNASGPGVCPDTSIVSGTISVAALAGASEIWIDYPGTNLQADYGYWGSQAGPGFRVTSNRADVEAVLCPAGMPDTTVPAGYTRLHVRWPWADPAVTGYPGTACEDDKAGITTPPYPTSLGIEFTACAGAQASLEFQNGHCPWYSLLVPDAWWPEAGGDKITLRYAGASMDQTLYSAALTLPARTADEYWLGYIGAPDDKGDFGTPCSNFSNRANAFAFFTANPGPGYAGCGGDGDVQVDPCSPPVPDGYSTVHFRYLWAGQKIFTYFPNKDLMPPWIVMEVNGGGGDKDIICFREADRPWFNCPVPNSEFYPGAKWRAVDKTHNPEWNTVEAKPFAETPGEWWLRWYYGKPDIPATARYKFYDYYPDATNGDWSATTDWNDEACAPKPPASGPPALGFQGWFPYDETRFAYGWGSSLARTFARADEVQDLLNAFVQERYLLWKENYVTEDTACGAGTARVKTDPPETVSEGQGYGLAITAAIGDKETFEKLWKFARHYLSQSSKKYCGGLLGWMWQSETDCRPLDSPCDPDTEGCGGNNDSAFDGDVDVGIGLVYAAMQWPEYRQAAVGWLLKMECEVNTVYDGTWNYPTPGDTFDKNCGNYPNGPCTYTPGLDGRVNMSYYPPGYFRVFGDFLARYAPDGQGETHRAFWYKTAATVYELYERGYDNPAVHPGLTSDWGTYTAPNSTGADNYNWSRALWRVGVDAAWFGHRTDIPENIPGSSQHYPTKSRVQAKIDNIQDYYSNFVEQNPVEPNANRFSTLCKDVVPAGTAAGCDPAYDHNSYFVNTAMTAYASVFDNDGETTADIRREALEEAVSTTVMNDRYYQESIGVYTMLFLSGNFPNPLEVP